MEDPGASDRFEGLRAEQRRRAALHSSVDAWRTAAVMTCLLAPFGLIFAVPALLLMRGVPRAIDAGEESAVEKKLGISRVVVLIGTAIGMLALLSSLALASRTAFALHAEIERTRSTDSSLPVEGSQ